MNKFKVWYDLDSTKEESLKEQAELILLWIGKEGTTYKIDNEDIMEFKIQLSSIDELIKLGADLGDDIVIYGADSDILMTKKTMKELGLD